MTATSIQGVRYAAGTHSYFAPGGAWLPGCTRILSDLGYNKGARFFTPESRQRGQALHWARLMVDQHAPDATTLDGVLERFDLSHPDPVETTRLHNGVAGWLLFKRELGFTPVRHEFPVWSPSLLVAGMPDVWGKLKDGTRVLADVKSWQSQGAKPKRAAEIQTAGYARMAKECEGLETDLRLVVGLPGDGRYRVWECTDKRDEHLFVCCAKIWHDRAQNGLIEGIGQESEVELIS